LRIENAELRMQAPPRHGMAASPLCHLFRSEHKFQP
jgi:hypothetical protein